jgi:uncharacterized RDD family membrane protein YckC
MTDDEFQAAVGRGTVASDTLVWRDGMKDWAPFSTVGYTGAAPADLPPLSAGYVRCAECGRSFPPDEVIAYAGKHVCGGCKAVFFQRVKEGAVLPGEFEYAGFWIRFAARFLDGIILGVVSTVMQIAFASVTNMGADPTTQLPLFIVYWLTSLAIGIAYPVFFLGKYGATPGKMAAGIKVVRPDGAPITYLRAFGRYFAESLSAIILFVGYLMAAFDDEKRALHDRICDTRVIKAR